MNNLTDFTDTTDVSDAAIEWVLRETGFCGGYAVKDVRDYADRGDYEDRTIVLAARLIQRHHPELLVDPVDAVIDEWIRENSYCNISKTREAAKRLYLLGIEKGKQS